MLFSDNALKINCLILFLCFRGTSVAEEVNNVKVQDILVYRRLSTLCSDVMKCRKFLSDKNIATLDVLRVCYTHTCVGVHIVASPCCGINISNISAWASRCRFIRRAMREPQSVERQLSSSTFFYVKVYNIFCFRFLAVYSLRS